MVTMESDPLPTPKQREALCNMVHNALVEIRMLGWGNRSAQVADLADAFHNLPNEIYNPSYFKWEHFRLGLQEHQEKWKGQMFGRDYVAMLEEIRLAP